MMTQKILHVGILAAGPGAKVIQNVYLPVLRALNQSFQTTAVYSSSPADFQNGHHTNGDASSPEPQPRIAPTVESVLEDPTVDLVFNFMPNEFHEVYTVAALANGKHVMLEAPISLSIQSAKRIIDAQTTAPNSAKVFVASARRYAPCVETFRQEVLSLDRIYYARCRNIAGPHAAHSATAPEEQWTDTIAHGVPKFSTSKPTSTSQHEEEGKKLLHNLLCESFCGQELSQARISLCQFLASLGCYDLALMRDTLGYPDAISNISVNEPFYSAIFHYTRGEDPFTLMYETGTDSVPRRDAHLAIYGRTKTVSIHYDLPYVPGHPLRVVVETSDETTGQLKTTETISSWEDAYKKELEALYSYLVEGGKARTTPNDAILDLKLFQTIFEQYDRQCGTIRTPLG